jgi:methyltransferase
MPGELFVGLILLQRIAELLWAGRNARHLQAKGAVEHGAAHYPLIVALHAAWLVVIATLAVGVTLSWVWVFVYLVLQGFRLWIIATLGPRWTTRVYVLSGAPLVTRGPFRFFRHPNYIVVALELAFVPLVLNAPLAALGFTLLNAAMMAIRIPCEEKALGEAKTSRD